MSTVGSKASRRLETLRKSPTGIQGLDEITGGGLPAGRPTLICGSAGCGKTLFGTEFLVHGATRYGEAGVFMSFEETGEELTRNVASLGFDLQDLVARKKLLIDHVQVERSEIQETGEYDLEWKGGSNITSSRPLFRGAQRNPRDRRHRAWSRASPPWDRRHPVYFFSLNTPGRGCAHKSTRSTTFRRKGLIAKPIRNGP